MNRELAETLLAQMIADELDSATRAELMAYLKTDAELSESLGDMRMAAGLLHDGLNVGEEPALRSAQRAALDALIENEPLTTAQHEEQRQQEAADSDAASVKAESESPAVLFTLRGAGAAAACLAISIGSVGLLMPSQGGYNSPADGATPESGITANAQSIEEQISADASPMLGQLQDKGIIVSEPPALSPHSPPVPTRPNGLTIHTDQSASAAWNGSVVWNDNHVDYEQRESINTQYGSVTRNADAPASGLLALADSSRETSRLAGGRDGRDVGGEEGLFSDSQIAAGDDTGDRYRYAEESITLRAESAFTAPAENDFFSFSIDLPFDGPDDAEGRPDTLRGYTRAARLDLNDALGNTNGANAGGGGGGGGDAGGLFGADHDALREEDIVVMGDVGSLAGSGHDAGGFNHSAHLNPGIAPGQQGQTKPDGWLADPISESEAAQTLGRELTDSGARYRLADGHASDEFGNDLDIAFNSHNTDTLLNIDTNGDGVPDATDGLPDNGSHFESLTVRGIGPRGLESDELGFDQPQERLAEAEDDVARLRTRLEGESRREELTDWARREADRAQQEEVQRLLHAAREQQSAGDYQQALQTLDAAAFIAPEDRTVRAFREVIQDVSLGVESHQLNHDLNLMRSNHQLVNDEAIIPYDEFLTYPGDWPQLTQMRLEGLDADAGDTEANRTAELALRRIISLEVETVRLGDVIDYIRDTTGANVAVNWPALELSGIDQDTPITLSLSRVPAEQLLRLAIEQAGASVHGDDKLGYTVIEGIVNISTLDDLKPTTDSRAYDIRDLLNVDQLPGMSREQAVAQLIQQLHQTVGDANEWLDEESTVRELNGNLIIKSTPENHRAILAVLNLMRGETPDDQAQPATPPANYPVNPWVLTQDDALSTFAVDVDTASYELARRHIMERGQLPAASSIRMEEFVNRFDYNYPTGQDAAETFRVHLEAGPAPFAEEGVALVKVGIRGRVVSRDQQKPAHLVFVIDASGSMAREDRLPLVQRSLAIVLEQLGPQDTVTLVSYDTAPYLLVEHASAGDAQAILEAAASIQTRGSTNLIDGMRLGYQVAARHFEAGGVNRVILCSDGVANVGSDDADGMLEAVAQYREHGITLTTLGVGIDGVGQVGSGLNDHLLEQLANRGDGHYLYLGSLREAHRLLATELSATAPIIARDVKIQVAFDPERVRRYRLIGYENRAIADADFRNDSVDAGEVFSGQSATALYEVELHPPRNQAPRNLGGRTRVNGQQADLGQVFIRYHDTRTDQVEETQCTLHAELLREKTPHQDPRFFLAACAAEFAERLRESEHGPGMRPGGGSGSDDALLQMISEVAEQLPLDSDVAELKGLIDQSRGLPRAQ